MREKRDLLTPNEEWLMNIFWTQEEPLTSIELVELTEEKGWYQEYILNMLRALKKKEMVEVCGIAPRRTQNARQFKAAITREEYFAKLIHLKGLEKCSLPKLAEALMNEGKDCEELIKALEETVERLNSDHARGGIPGQQLSEG